MTSVTKVVAYTRVYVNIDKHARDHKQKKKMKLDSLERLRIWRNLALLLRLSNARMTWKSKP
jgi:hypothetical protein